MKTKLIVIFLLPFLILLATKLFANTMCLAADDNFKDTPISKVRNSELSNKKAFTGVEGYTDADLWKYRICRILTNFQKCPAWLIWLFLPIWICGGVYYMYRKLKSTRTNLSLKKAKEGMYVNMVGFALSLFILLKITDWVKCNLISCISGIHEGFVDGICFFAVFYICIFSVNLFWKIFRKFQPDQQ